MFNSNSLISTVGQLGVGDENPRCYPTQLKTLRSIGVRNVQAGDDFSVFLTLDGGVFSCGAHNATNMIVSNFSLKLLIRNAWQVPEALDSWAMEIKAISAFREWSWKWWAHKWHKLHVAPNTHWRMCRHEVESTVSDLIRAANWVLFGSPLLLKWIIFYRILFIPGTRTTNNSAVPVVVLGPWVSWSIRLLNLSTSKWTHFF